MNNLFIFPLRHLVLREYFILATSIYKLIISKVGETSEIL
jgi:hypothetical protein